MSGVLGTLAAARSREISVKIITDSEVRAEWEAAVNGLDEAAAEDARHGSLDGDKPATTAALDRIEDLRDRVAASQVEFVFAPLPWTEYVALQAEHPPAEGDPIHARRGYNVTTFLAALIRRCCVRVVGADASVSTEVPAETWDHLIGAPAQPAEGRSPAVPAVAPALDYGAVNLLGAAASKANDGDRTVPPSARALLPTQASDASSTPRKPGQARRRSGSAGGSRPGSPKSSTTKKKPDHSSLESPAVS